MKRATSLVLGGLAAGLAMGLVLSATAAGTGAISALFSAVTGNENGAAVPVGAYRLDGDKIKDGTVTSYEIANGTIKAEDLALGVGGGSDNMGNHVASQNLNMSGFTITGAVRITGPGDICIGTTCP